MREREFEPDALSAPEGFFFRVYNSSPRSASSASPELEALEPPSRPTKYTLWDDFDRLMERKARGDHPILLESLECVDVRARRCSGPGDMRAEALARAVCSCSCGIRREGIPPISSGLWSLVAIQCSTHAHEKAPFQGSPHPKSRLVDRVNLCGGHAKAHIRIFELEPIEIVDACGEKNAQKRVFSDGVQVKVARPLTR